MGRIPPADEDAGHGLRVSLLTFWNPPTTAQVTVESVPPNAAEGKDVLLRVHNLPVNLIGFGWFKGETVEPRSEIVSYAADSQEITPGYAHSGRETLYLSGSLLFQNINLEDMGYYTVRILKRNFQIEIVTRWLRVYPELPKPNITSNNSDPVENVDSVVLTCEPQTHNTSYLWSVNSKSLPDSARLELSLDNRTLTLHGVTRNDTGPYECETWNPVSAGHSDPFTLNVLSSNPPAQYSWIINGSPQPSSQEFFIPNITVNDTGSYACLVYNPGTRLNKFTVKTITVSDGRSPTGLPVGTSVGIAIGVLVGVALVASLGYVLLRVKTGRASGQRNHREMGHPACTPGHGPVSSSTSPSALPSPRTAVPIYQELQHPDRNIYCQINHKGQVSS
ncbi:carcinoembryonic antigen-related cell adhesion molecule 1-like [Puma concolor]|uniref:Carcinoembryonic antigen-related cell adhesion molecule 1-like n=1 Tax=Puma concolor TaxID=9696 RepID=A0A6P6H4G5_PUMCO|nr:carcinoembryonic antigen-related cell adhesion molecule 1-like [Puma concolor]